MNENVNVCITPKGDKPVLHFSQFDNERVFTVTVLADDGESAAVLTGLNIEFRLRKTDSHVVTIAPESVADNVITFKTTEQMCACCGQNIATVTLMKDDMIVSTLDILVDIQRDILSGGLTSESDIRNLTTQIEQIVPEVVGDNYYNKSEVDDLIAEHTFDPSNYYDKSEVDDLIAEHTFDPSNYYDKSEVDGLLDDKTDKSAIASLIVQKDVSKAPIASFNTDLNDNLTKCIVDINPVQSGTGTPSPDNVRPISGFSALNVTRTGVNLWDEEWELGNINSSGVPVADGYTRIRSKNFIPCTPNTTFYIKEPSNTSNFKPFFYDCNNVFISEGTWVGNNTTTTPLNCCYMKFVMATAYGTTYNNDISINYPSSDTEYHAYNGQTAKVNFGQTVYGGVADVTNGKVYVAYAKKKINELTWSYVNISGAERFFSDLLSEVIETPTTIDIVSTLKCSCYETISQRQYAQFTDNNIIAVQSTGYIVIRDTNYTSVSDLLNAVGEQEICYPLATPIEITTTPENLTAISGENNVYGDTNGDIAVRFTETIGNELGV